MGINELMPNISKQDIVNSLIEVGVEKGDKLFVHNNSDLFKYFDGCKKNKDSAKLLLNCLKDAVGDDGLIIVPTFFYDFCKGSDFDIDNTPSQVGYFSTYILNNNESIRTSHPIFSVAMIGRSAKELCENISTDAFGKESIFDKLYNLSRSKILFFNSNFDTCTFVHYVEQMYNVNYRYIKEFKGDAIIGGEKFSVLCTYFVRPLDGTVNTDMDKLELHVIKKKLLKTANLYNGMIKCIGVNDFVNETSGMLNKDKYWLLSSSDK
jgi:aminoglycoside 3-N-acetyltransferase